VPRSDDPGQTPVPTRVEPSARLTDVRILVVDDSEFNREIAQCILINEGAIVTTHSDGQQALDQLRATPHAFDIVLMDVQMPRMDGNEATSRIRGELGLNDLPVIALTAGALLVERQRALDAGMSDFVSKPLDPDTLVRLVRRHVDERYAGRRHPAATPPPTAA
jgi:CheY-like chemotaxis protein